MKNMISQITRFQTPQLPKAFPPTRQPQSDNTFGDPPTRMSFKVYKIIFLILSVLNSCEMDFSLAVLRYQLPPYGIPELADLRHPPFMWSATFNQSLCLWAWLGSRVFGPLDFCIIVYFNKETTIKVINFHRYIICILIY
jgi:hypothetical protein